LRTETMKQACKLGIRRYAAAEHTTRK
jgi:hypothetical protein